MVNIIVGEALFIGGVTMKMKALDASHLMIILTAQETRSLGLDTQGLSWNNLHCRLTIAHIFAAACAKTNFVLPPRREQIAIRAMETADGETVLMFSAASPAKAKKGAARKIYRIKAAGPYVYEIEDAGNLLNVLERLYSAQIRGICQAVKYGGQYRIILSPYCTARGKADAILREYGSLCGIGRPAAAFALEHGVLLCDDAVNLVGSLIAAEKPPAAQQS